MTYVAAIEVELNYVLSARTENVHNSNWHCRHYTNFLTAISNHRNNNEVCVAHSSQQTEQQIPVREMCRSC